MRTPSLVLDRWRAVFAALPLPMLALAASYGVFSYALLFVPFWVAIVQAAAFELTYIGLAVVRVAPGQRRRASAISLGAVIVSIAYNTIAGLFHRRPDLLADLPLWGEVLLACLHGLPLALVAFLIADLLLHQEPAVELPATAPALAADTQVTAPATQGATPRAVKLYHCKRCNAGPMSFPDLGRHRRVCPGAQPAPAAG